MAEIKNLSVQERKDLKAIVDDLNAPAVAENARRAARTPPETALPLVTEAEYLQKRADEIFASYRQAASVIETTEAAGKAERANATQKAQLAALETKFKSDRQAILDAVPPK